MDKNIYRENLSKKEKKQLNFIEAQLKENNLYAFNSIALKLDISQNVDFSKSLKELGLKHVPICDENEENKFLSQSEYEIARFGESVLNSRDFRLQEKKQFIRYIDSVNPSYTKVAMSLFNINNMNMNKLHSLDNTVSIEDSISFYELLSYYTEVSDLKNPKDKDFFKSFIDKFPKIIGKNDYGYLFGKTIQYKIPAHREKKKLYDNNLKKYIEAEQRKIEQPLKKQKFNRLNNNSISQR